MNAAFACSGLLHTEILDILSIGAAGDEFKNRLVEALPQTQVTLYFPSEYGVDHTIHDFPNKTWDFKKRHMDLARRAASDKNAYSNRTTSLKVCRVFIGLFLEDIIPPLGFATEKGTFEAAGPFDTKISYTSMDDVGKILAAIATMLPGELAQLPETIRLSGTEVSMAETADMIMAATGKHISVTSVDGLSFKRKTLESGDQNPYPFLRFLMGDGSVDYRAEAAGGLGNDNELVNPGGAKFRWKTMQDFVNESYRSV